MKPLGAYEEGCLLMRPPKAEWSQEKSGYTILTVDSANREGSLLEIGQLLETLDLNVTKATITTGGHWILDIFHIVDHLGRKVEDERILTYINAVLKKDRETLATMEELRTSLGRPVKRLEILGRHTAIELIGNDRAGLLAECADVLSKHHYAVVASPLWTHAGRIASIVYVKDEPDVPQAALVRRVERVSGLLSKILLGEKDSKITPKVKFTTGLVQPERRLHQMLFADRDYDDSPCNDVDMDEDSLPYVLVRNCPDTGYTVVYIKTAYKPKLFFDSLCTLTDMKYDVHHATITTVDGISEQEYYLKDMDGCLLETEAERIKVKKCMLAAIQRRNPEGVCLILREEDRPGLLARTTEMFKMHDLSISKAEIDTVDGQAVNYFFVTAADGGTANMDLIRSMQREIGQSLEIVEPPKANEPPKSFIVKRTAAIVKSFNQFFQLFRFAQG